jgi:hypothetical protein
MMNDLTAPPAEAKGAGLLGTVSPDSQGHFDDLEHREEQSQNRRK